MKFSYLLLLPVILTFLMSGVHSSSLFDLFFGRSYNAGYRSGYNRRPKSSGRSNGGGYNEYKKICSVINPSPYAFIGSNPYPAVPFCPP